MVAASADVLVRLTSDVIGPLILLKVTAGYDHDVTPAVMCRRVL